MTALSSALEANFAESGEVKVQQGDTVWGSLRNAGYSDAQIVSQGLVNQVAQASGLQNPDMIRPGDVLKLPSNGNSVGATPKQGTPQQATPELKQRAEQALTAAGLPISQEAIDLIISSEGLNQPGKWPGESSGITLGVGYDLGHVTPEQFRKDWGDKLTPDQMNRLEQVIGLTGRDAKAVAGRFGDINISREDAAKVFHEATLPEYFVRTQAAFPGMENLSPDVQGVLTSLVINRG